MLVLNNHSASQKSEQFHEGQILVMPNTLKLERTREQSAHTTRVSGDSSGAV